jgi:hypothetical protein
MKFSFFPNPMHESATLSFTNAKAQPVKIFVYDLSGRMVKAVAEGTYPAGGHSISFDKGDLRNGLYILKLETAEGAFNTRIVIN